MTMAAREHTVQAPIEAARLARIGHRFGHIEQRLAREVEGARPAARLGFRNAQLAREMAEILADCKGGRGKIQARG